jgi:hypothetical protein
VTDRTAIEYDEAEEQVRWQQRYATGRRIVTPGGKHLSDMGAQTYASDPRYRPFADFVSPLQWQVAAQKRSLSLRQVLANLLAAGPDPVLLSRVYPGMLVAEWDRNVRRCYELALQEDSPERDDFNAHGGRVTPAREYDEDVLSRPKPRPAGLEGYPRKRRNRTGVMSRALGRRGA